MAGVEPISGAAPSRRILTAGPSPARASCTRARSISRTNAATMCGEAKGLKVPVAQAASGIERRFEHTARRRTRHFERDRLDTSVRVQDGSSTGCSCRAAGSCESAAPVALFLRRGRASARRRNGRRGHGSTRTASRRARFVDRAAVEGTQVALLVRTMIRTMTRMASGGLLSGALNQTECQRRGLLNWPHLAAAIPNQRVGGVASSRP